MRIWFRFSFLLFFSCTLHHTGGGVAVEGGRGGGVEWGKRWSSEVGNSVIRCQELAGVPALNRK